LLLDVPPLGSELPADLLLDVPPLGSEPPADLLPLEAVAPPAPLPPLTANVDVPPAFVFAVAVVPPAGNLPPEASALLPAVALPVGLPPLVGAPPADLAPPLFASSALMGVLEQPALSTASSSP